MRDLGAALFLGIQTGKQIAFYALKRIEPAGWRLIGKRATYDIHWHDGTWTCDCQDATYRGRECKHLKALQETGLS